MIAPFQIRDAVSLFNKVLDDGKIFNLIKCNTCLVTMSLSDNYLMNDEAGTLLEWWCRGHILHYYNYTTTILQLLLSTYHNTELLHFQSIFTRHINPLRFDEMLNPRA